MHGGHFAADDGGELAQVGALELRLYRALLEARDVEQAADEARHFLRLSVYRGYPLFVVFFGQPLFFERGALREDDGGRRAQLVRGVGGELFFRLEGCFKAREHSVEGRGYSVYLVVLRRQTDARGEVAAFVYRVGCGYHAVYRAEGAAHYEVPARRAYEHEHRQDDEREPRHR